MEEIFRSRRKFPNKQRRHRDVSSLYPVDEKMLFLEALQKFQKEGEVDPGPDSTQVGSGVAEISIPTPSVPVSEFAVSGTRVPVPPKSAVCPGEPLAPCPLRTPPAPPPNPLSLTAMLRQVATPSSCCGGGGGVSHVAGTSMAMAVNAAASAATAASALQRGAVRLAARLHLRFGGFGETLTSPASPLSSSTASSFTSSSSSSPSTSSSSSSCESPPTDSVTSEEGETGTAAMASGDSGGETSTSAPAASAAAAPATATLREREQRGSRKRKMHSRAWRCSRRRLQRRQRQRQRECLPTCCGARVSVVCGLQWATDDADERAAYSSSSDWHASFSSDDENQDGPSSCLIGHSVRCRSPQWRWLRYQDVAPAAETSAAVAVVIVAGQEQHQQQEQDGDMLMDVDAPSRASTATYAR